MQEPLANVAFEACAVNYAHRMIDLCMSCWVNLHKKRMPSLALANKMSIGSVSPELCDLTFIEESMITLCYAKCTVVHLKYDGIDNSHILSNLQHSMKGNVIEYLQHSEKLTTILPLPIDDVTSYICVIFVGSGKPSN